MHRQAPCFQFALVPKRSLQSVSGEKTKISSCLVSVYFLLLIIRLAFFIRHQNASLFF